MSPLKSFHKHIAGAVSKVIKQYFKFILIPIWRKWRHNNSDNQVTLGGTLCLDKDYLHLRDKHEN